MQLSGRRPIGVTHAVRCALLGVLFLLLTFSADAFAQLPTSLADTSSLVAEVPAVEPAPESTTVAPTNRWLPNMIFASR